MPLDATEIEALVTRIQDAFLDTPNLTLTLSQAEKRFTVDRITCQAIFGALIEAHVLMRTDEGGYIRFFPQLTTLSNRQVRRANGCWQIVA